MKKDKKKSNKYQKLLDDAIKDLKTPGKRYKQIPNILTASRLFAPFLIIPVAITGNIPLVITLAIGFGLTDLADGFIARNWNLTSELGKNLDALADKLFSGTLLLAASITNPLLLINVGLEMVIAGVNIYHEAKGCNTKSNMTGKIKTWALFILAGLGIAIPYSQAIDIINGLSIVTAGLQGATVMSYLTQNNSSKQKAISSKKETYQPPKMEIKTIPEAIELIKTKEKEFTEPSQEELLEKLSELRKFLEQEQKNLQEINLPVIPTQKQKK